MAAIDEKIAAIQFETTTARAVDDVARIVDDAAEFASAGGEKLTLSRSGSDRIDGVAKNWIRVTHAEFSVWVTPAAEGGTLVRFRIDNVLRTRDTIYFIPVSPWQAPAYPTLRAFSEHLRAHL
ncbi:hypothetical protein [Microbacterium sp. B19]|uniref:hypothetical protein n=1 Tax=Microbacterium sp. B19 TaxID=96765 RepID=UPI00034DAAB3|nr:hypothetical protein [Microbacterium sp. B19]